MAESFALEVAFEPAKGLRSPERGNNESESMMS